MKNWEERSTMQNSTIVYATLYMRAQKIIKDVYKRQEGAYTSTARNSVGSGSSTSPSFNFFFFFSRSFCSFSFASCFCFCCLSYVNFAYVFAAHNFRGIGDDIFRQTYLAGNLHSERTAWIAYL